MDSRYYRLAMYCVLLFMCMISELSAQPIYSWKDSVDNLYAQFNQKESMCLHKAIIFNEQYIPVAIGEYVYQDEFGNSDTMKFLYRYSHVYISLEDFNRMGERLRYTSPIACHFSIPILVAEDEFEIRRFEYSQEMGQLIEAYLAEERFPFTDSYLLITTIDDAYKVSCTDYGGCWYYHIPPKKSARMKQKLDKLHKKQLRHEWSQYSRIW